MEVALTALRQFSLGAVSDATVYRTAAAVSVAAPAPAAVDDSQPAPTSEESLDIQASPELLPHDGSSPIVAFTSSPNLEAEPGDVVSELYTWGRAKNYQLGFGASGEEQPVPRLVSLPKGISVKSISCGQFHSVAVTSCGSVFCWGFSGTAGRLGLDSSDGAAASCIEPSRLSEFGPGRHSAVKAASGLNHSLAVTAAGALFAWGSNAQGQLGLQGVRTGEGAVVQRPQSLKGPLKGEVVVDVAAGAAHSLCCIEAGAALAWGSNERGALGLGAPPAGPATASSPQRLPHLKGTRAVFASAAGHVCAALVSGHGDALIFGSPPAGPVPAAGRGAGGAGGSGGAADARHFVPSRVLRRRGRGGAAAEGEAWQTAQRTAAPLRTLVLGTEVAFGVDTEAVLWTWPLRGQRPCSAEEVVVSAPADAGSRGPPLLSGVRAVAVADRLGAVWAIDSTPASRLWRLKQTGDAWTAERSEHLAQVSSLACGPEHQAAVVSFRRPEEALPPARTSPDFVLTVEGDGEESEEEEEGAPITREIQQPVSLQELCEEKLCREVSPRSLGLLCEAALEFDRPVALDRAFVFLRANAALMFSKQHLPVLSQLPVEILAAFELVAAGQFPTPSAALEVYSAGFPFDDMPTVPEAEPVPKDASSGSLSAKEAGALKAGGQRRKRRGAGAGGTPKLQESATPQLSSTASPAARAAAAAAAVSPGLLPASPAGAAKAAGAQRPARSLESPASGLAPSPAVANGAKAASPKARASPDAAVPKDWVEVRTRRKAGSGSAPGPGSPGTPFVPQSPGPPPPAAAGATSPQMESLAPPAVPLRPMATLGDFVRAPGPGPAAAAGSAPLEGPSAVLSAAVQSIRGERPPKAAPWAVAAAAGEPAEAPKLRDIIKEEGGGKGAAGAGARGPASAEATTCSWGRDAMPSEKPKGRSVYEIQQQEEVEKEKLRADDEIREIEAMFAALEVAERVDAEEQHGPSASSSSKGGPKAKKASAKQPAATKPPRGGGEKGRQQRPQPESKPSNDEKWSNGEKWSRESWNSRARGRGGGGNSGWDSWSGNGWSWSDESWQWSESVGGSKKWKAKQDDGEGARGEEPPGS